MISPYDPTPLEIASGVVVGGTSLSLDSGRPSTPLDGLERAILPALLRSPCLVSFSGGVDSSVVLAVATRLARRSGLPDPVPCTWRVHGAPGAEESGWQESVVRALRLREWQVLEATDDLDLVGPVATPLLVERGVRHPTNLHLHVPLLERAAGGSLLTGIGGDQILSGWRRPTGGGLVRHVKRSAPASLVAAGRQLRDRPLPWLRPRVEHRVWAARVAEVEAEPRRWGPRVLWHAGRRSLQLGLRSLRQLAHQHDVLLGNPLVDEGFVRALAHLGGSRPAPRRHQTIAAIAAEAVPEMVHQRRTKAHFREVFFREATRSFLTTWDGSGVDPQVVDVGRLRQLWSTWPVPPGTAGLVQQAYLASTGPDRRDQTRETRTSYDEQHR